MASNMMELMKSKFASMSKDELSLTARSANDDLAMGFMSSGNMQLMIAGNFVLQSCLRLGFCTRKLSEKQQWLMKELYRLSEETRNQQSAAAVEAITETDYQLIEKLAGSNRQISEAMFNLIMCAAYADGGLKAEVERKIDPIFGFLFAALFAESGMESVPVPKIRVTGLEAHVLDYMLKKDTMMPLSEITKAFPRETKETVKKALDGLCEKDLVHWLFNVIGEPYSADVDREDVDIVLMEDIKAPVKPAKSAKEIETEKKRKEEIEKKRKEEEAEKKRKEEAERKAAAEAKKKKEEEERRTALVVQKTLDRDRARVRIAMGMIACSMYHVVAVKPNGTVIAAGKNDDGQCNVSGWRNIVSVACDECGTVGVTADGRVMYTGSSLYKQSRCTSWYGIKQVALSGQCVFGLRENGTVVASIGYAPQFSSSPDVTTWNNIVQIYRMGECVVGIDSNGRVMSVNKNYYGRTENERCHAQSSAIDAAVGDYDTVIVQKQDGTCPRFSPSQYKPQEILKIYLLQNRPVAILSDGRLLFDQKNGKDTIASFASSHTSEKIIAVSGSLYKCAFLTEQGRIYIVGRDSYSFGGEVAPGEPFGNGFRLFDSFDKLMDEREKAQAELAARKEEEKKQKKEEEKKRAAFRERGVCQYCGGEFKKGFLSTKCTECGAKKDY